MSAINVELPLPAHLCALKSQINQSSLPGFTSHMSLLHRDSPCLCPGGWGPRSNIHLLRSQGLHLYDKQEYQTVWYFTVLFTQLCFLWCLQYFMLWPHGEMQCSAGHSVMVTSSAVTQSDGPPVSWDRNSRRMILQSVDAHVRSQLCNSLWFLAHNLFSSSLLKWN